MDLGFRIYTSDLFHFNSPFKNIKLKIKNIPRVITLFPVFRTFLVGSPKSIISS